jgi:hypothetical protein
VVGKRDETSLLTLPRLSVILNGLIRITAPASALDEPNASLCAWDGLAAEKGRPKTKVAYIMPGTALSSVLIAADLKSASTIAGHFTEFPSDEATILVQVPFVDNKVPTHTVLYDGPCA